MNYEEITKLAKSLYPVNKVAKGCEFWTRTLTEKCLGIFKYTGLPQSLPADEIELRLITTGYAAVFKRKGNGNLVTSYGGLSGYDEYYHPTKFVYAQPVLGSDNLKIDENCVIIYNSQVDVVSPMGMYEFIRRYARMLADIDSSINIVTVNTRATALNVASTQAVAISINEAMKKIQLGDYAVITDLGILDNFKTFPFYESRNNDLTQLITARENILKAFFEEIGIKSNIQKRERLISDEVESDTQKLIMNLSDMLEHRQADIKKVNKMFDTKITVDISEEYKPKPLVTDEGGTEE